MIDKTEAKTLIVILLLIILGLSIRNITLSNNKCEGIGGFVYKEIEWTDQTYNIVSHYQDLDGMNIPVLYYNDDVKQFYVIEKECNKQGCRYKDIYLPTMVQK